MRNALSRTIASTAVLAALLAAAPAFAAQLSFESSNPAPAVGERFSVAVLLDTQGDEINADGGSVTFPGDLVEFLGASDAGSIVSFWIEPPALRGGVVTFSGITPGAFNGHRGLLFTLEFRAKKAGAGMIGIVDAKTLRNDGTGMSASVVVSSLSLRVSPPAAAPSPSVPVAPTVADRQPPEPFTPEIGRDPNVFDGQWFVAFATEDKGSGMSGYEVKESRSRIFAWLVPWKPASTPYLLADQELQSYVFVKAVDRAGNERVAMLAPAHAVPWYERDAVWGILLGAAVLWFATFLRKKGSRRRSS